MLCFYACLPVSINGNNMGKTSAQHFIFKEAKSGFFDRKKQKATSETLGFTQTLKKNKNSNSSAQLQISVL